MDTIFIREFRVDAWVGIYEWEKQRAQTLEMEIDIAVPGNEVGRTDNIHDTVHYGEVIERIRAELGQRRFRLLEALAEHCCDIIVNDFRAPWVRLSVAKLGHIRGVRKVGVLIERRRDSAREAPMLKWLLVIVVGVAVITLATPWLGRHGLGRLPGDITVRWRGRRIYLPITSTIVLSLLLTLFGRLV